jgi:small-conductance mechanosensitive channel
MPAWWTELTETSFLGNSVPRWLAAVIVLVALFLVLRLVDRLVAKRLARVAAARASRPWKALADAIASTKAFFLLAVSAAVATLLLDLPAEVTGIPGQVLVFATFVQTGVWATRFIASWVAHVPPAAGDAPAARKALPHLAGLVARVAVWVVVGILLLQNLGVEVTALVAGLGVGGIAIALAVQNVLGDLLASLSIALDEPFVPGDFIIVDDLAGTVEQVGLKTTRVRGLGGERLVFANSDLLKSRIRNFKHMKERRIVFTVGVTYQTPTALLPEIAARLRTIVTETPGARLDRAHFKAFGGSSLDFEVVYFVEAPEYAVYMDAQQHINLTILEQFAELGVEFAYPTRTIHVAPGAPVPVALEGGSAREAA